MDDPVADAETQVQVEERRIGPDRVRLRGDRLLIESPTPMDWEVRSHRRLLVHYAGREWTPKRIERSRTGGARYVLQAWSPSALELPGAEVEYDLAYVEEREFVAACFERRLRVSTALELLSPLVGLLPARQKLRLEDNYGIDSVAATARAVAIEALLIGPAVAVVTIEVVASGIAAEDVGLPWRTCVVAAVVLALDVLVRRDCLLAEEHPPPGFYEWAWRWLGQGAAREARRETPSELEARDEPDLPHAGQE